MVELTQRGYIINGATQSSFYRPVIAGAILQRMFNFNDLFDVPVSGKNKTFSVMTKLIGNIEN